jgi:hypothetical protein
VAAKVRLSERKAKYILAFPTLVKKYLEY